MKNLDTYKKIILSLFLALCGAWLIREGYTDLYDNDTTNVLMMLVGGAFIAIAVAYSMPKLNITDRRLATMFMIVIGTWFFAAAFIAQDAKAASNTLLPFTMASIIRYRAKD